MDPEAPPSSSKSAKSPEKTQVIFGAVISVVAIATISALALKFTVFSSSHKNIHHSSRVESANFQIIHLSGSQLSARFDINFSVHNPGVKDMDVEVSYKQQPLATNSVSSVPTGGGNIWNPVEVKLRLDSVQLNEAQDLVSEVANGSASFNVRLYAGYWIGTESASTVSSALEETCQSLKIGFSSDKKDGKLLNGPIQCAITRPWN